MATIEISADNGTFPTTAAFALTVTNVGGDGLRSVQITSPDNGSMNVLPVVLAAAADDHDGVLTNIQFFANGSLIGSLANYPWSFSWSGNAVGSQTLSALNWVAGQELWLRWSDNTAKRQMMGIDNVQVQVLSDFACVLTNPTKGATYNAPVSVLLAANAFGGTNPVTKVEFFAGATTREYRRERKPNSYHLDIKRP